MSVEFLICWSFCSYFLLVSIRSIGNNSFGVLDSNAYIEMLVARLASQSGTPLREYGAVPCWPRGARSLALLIEWVSDPLHCILLTVFHITAREYQQPVHWFIVSNSMRSIRKHEEGTQTHPVLEVSYVQRISRRCNPTFDLADVSGIIYIIGFTRLFNAFYFVNLNIQQMHHKTQIITDNKLHDVQYRHPLEILSIN